MPKWLLPLAPAVLVSTSCREPAPQPPFKTAEELKRAVEFALVRQDTNLFWSLHCWTNVTAQAERIHRKFSEGLFEKSPRDRYKFRSFGFRPPFSNDNVPKRRKNGSYSQWNVPIDGYVFFNQYGRDGESLPGYPHGTKFSADGGLGYGKRPDGTYWLAVVTDVAPTNAIPKQVDTASESDAEIRSSLRVVL